MSKLSRLKEWWTLADAARDLSAVLGRLVTESDLLRHALDGLLTLSVYFVNVVLARVGSIVWLDEASLSHPADPFSPIKGVDLQDGTVLEFLPGIIELAGVFDLPMSGAEIWHVEQEYQRLTNGPEVTPRWDDGPFVQDGPYIYELLEDNDRSPYLRGTRAALDRLKTRIKVKKLSQKEADRLLKKHARDRTNFLARQLALPEEARYHATGRLPSDGVLVIRRSALMEFVERERGGAEGDAKADAPAVKSLLHIIGVQSAVLLGQTPADAPGPPFKNQAALIVALEHLFPTTPGIKKRTLEKAFALANRSLAKSSVNDG